LLASDALTLASRHSVTAGESCDGSTVADVCDIAWLLIGNIHPAFGWGLWILKKNRGGNFSSGRIAAKGAASNKKAGQGFSCLLFDEVP
jgi:hypothetical protein